jgi:lysophospholipase
MHGIPESYGAMEERLVDFPDNPVPFGATVGHFKGFGGVRIRHARFGAEARPLKGTVILLPGRNECIEKYFETIRDLSARGFGCAIMDWRGQGGSGRMLKDRQRGYVESFDEYVADLEQFIAEHVLPDCRPPFYILGHSTGSLVALLAAPSLFNRVRRMVLIAPLLELVGQPLSTANLRRASALAYSLGLGSLYVSGGPRPAGGWPFAGNKLTSDLRRYTRNQALLDREPALVTGGPTVAWIHAACVAADTVRDPDFLSRIHIPILFVTAGADQVVSTSVIEAVGESIRPGSVITIDGAGHEILQEADIYREQLLAAFDAFVPGTDQTV